MKIREINADHEIARPMKPEMRQKLAREPFAKKNCKVARLIRLAKTFPRRQREI
jgi:hypothetical protein